MQMNIDMVKLGAFLRSGDWKQLAHSLPGEAIKPVLDVLSERREGIDWLEQYRAGLEGQAKQG
jgi:hypothetical protein